jgi:hypothetical protein
VQEGVEHSITNNAVNAVDEIPNEDKISPEAEGGKSRRRTFQRKRKFTNKKPKEQTSSDQ